MLTFTSQYGHGHVNLHYAVSVVATIPPNPPTPIPKFIQPIITLKLSPFVTVEVKSEVCI
jgi:hypothetical protein